MLAVAAVAVVALGAWLWTERSGIVVRVVNAQTERTLRDVVVVTSAGGYRLGDVAPGASAATLVGARGESSVLVVWTDAGGTRRRAETGPYIEGSEAGAGMYGGTVDVTFTDDTSPAVDADVEGVLGLLPRGTAPPAAPAELDDIPK